MRNILSPTVLFLTMLFCSCKTSLQYGDIFFESNRIAYDTHEKNDAIVFVYQTEESPYLNALKEKYPLDSILDESTSDMETVLGVLNWTNSRWAHNGNNTPSQLDAISILLEAESGGQFPCFAYAIVLRDQLNALGFHARTVYLKSKNAHTSKFPPGHVATEVFLNDLQKWAFVDGQFNVMPTLHDVPINAVEFQKAISQHAPELKLWSINSLVQDNEYYSFVYPYLYYLDTGLDNRYEFNEPFVINNKSTLMLVPLGAKHLKRINFWDMDIDNCIYTNSSLDFYAPPN